MASYAVLLLFFVSGGLALGYQVLWSKYVLDFIGVSAYSYATVLAAFMGGLAIGSSLIGRLSDRVSSPLKLYAYLELGVGAYGIALYLPLTRLVANLYGGWVSFTPAQAGETFAIWAKILASGLLLLPPTILLGGTFPAMVRHMTERLGVVGRRTSQLYAVNALGAVLGALGMAFVCLPVLGMRASLMTLGLSNGAVALAALVITRWSAGPAASLAHQQGVAAASHSDLSVIGLKPWQIRLGLFVILAEGLLGFAYEIAWTRHFGIVLGSSTYSFAIMLAAFITGISLGSAILIRLDRRITNPIHLFGWTQIVVGVLVTLAVPAYPYIPWIFKQCSSLLSFRPEAFYLYEFAKLLICFAVMLPPTVFIGMSLPLVVKGLGRSLASLGQDVGRVYAWDTWGDVGGSLLAGLALLPALGVEYLVRSAAVGNGVLGMLVVCCYTIHKPRGRASRVGAAAVCVAIIVGYNLLEGGWDRGWLAIAPYRRRVESVSLSEIRDSLRKMTVLLFKDDPAAHLMVVQDTEVPEEPLTLYVNGKPDASSHFDMPTQVLSGHLPLLLHPEPKDVLIVGLASGVTAGAALRHDVRRVDVVDVVRSMPEATRHFGPWNGDPFADPRFRLIIDDGRSYLAYTRQQYDVIISEPSNPWMAGISALFSEEMYLRATEVLRPGGVYLQWVQAYEIADQTLAVVLRTFSKVFRYVYGYQGSHFDLLLIGSSQPVQPGWSRLQSRFERPAVLHQLASFGIVDLPTLLFFQRFTPTAVACMASATHLCNSDDNHFLEYRAPRDLFQNLKPTVPDIMDERLYGSPGLLWSQFCASHPGAVGIERLLSVFSDVRIGSGLLRNTLHQARYHLEEGFPERRDGGSGPQTPDSFVPRPPLLPDQIVQSVNALLGRGEVSAAAGVVEEYYAAICLECSMSPDAAGFWTPNVQSWVSRSRFREDREVFRRLWIDVLAAQHRLGEASRELMTWIEGTSPPSAVWAMSRACLIDQASLCGPAARSLLRPRPGYAPNEYFLRNLAELLQ